MKLKFCYNQDVTNSILGKQVQEGGVPMRKFLILFIIPVTINVVSYLIYKLGYRTKRVGTLIPIIER